MTQMGYEKLVAPSLLKVLPHVVVESPKAETKKEETMKEKIHSMAELMKNLSLNLMEG